MRLLLIFLLPLALSFADYAPVLSTSGKQRVADNILILDKNLNLIQGNIINCKKNAHVIEAELNTLAQLEQEHLQLREKYKGQISAIQQEVDKNDTAIKELDKFQKNITKNTSSETETPPSQQADLIRSQKDRMVREKWKSEAKTKIDKINTLVKAVNQNITSIDEKKLPLREQLAQLNRKEKEYQKLLSELANKKIESEQILKTQN